MQISVNIPNDSLAEKILWMLEHFKNDGVEILKLNSQNENEILSGFQEGLQEIKSIQKGILKSKPIEDLLDEL